MISPPVAFVPKEIPPPQANAPVASTIDFSQLLSTGDAVPPQAPTQSTSTSAGASQGATDSAPAPDAPRHHRHWKARAEDATANAAAVLPVPTTTAQTVKTVASGAAAAATATPSPGTVLGAGAVSAGVTTQPIATPNNAGSNGNGLSSSQGAPQPPGAADLEARVAVGAPTYLSQPNNPALLELLHHPGVNAPQPGDASGANDAGASSDDDMPASNAAAGRIAATANGVAVADAHAAVTAVPGPDGNDAQAGADTTLADAPVPTSADAAAGANASAAAGLQVTDSTTTQSTSVAPEAATTALSQPVPAQVLPAYEQVAINLRQAAQTGTDRIEIQLKPASLGAIHVKLDVTHDGHVSAVISADRSDTLNALRQNSSGLEQALRDAGLQTNSGSLSFNLRGDAQSFAQNQQGSSAPSGSSESGGSAQADANQPTSRYRRHDGALDIEV
jgi:hypothetical protein